MADSSSFVMTQLSLHKSEFICYMSMLWLVPSFDFCLCGEKFTIYTILCHAQQVVFPPWHNKLRDVFASLLYDVCHDGKLEPMFQSLSGEILSQKSNSREDEACLDFSSCGSLVDYGVGIFRRHILMSESSTPMPSRSD